MFSDHIYNLINQLTQEHKSLWRIKNMYQDDSGECKKCQKFWKKMEKDKEDHIEELTELIKAHMEK
ncbi:MAG: hypothetical protein ABEI53_01585 [Candidatus Magasanikbacteria bacterium]